MKERRRRKGEGQARREIWKLEDWEISGKRVKERRERKDRN